MRFYSRQYVLILIILCLTLLFSCSNPETGNGDLSSIENENNVSTENTEIIINPEPVLPGCEIDSSKLKISLADKVTTSSEKITVIVEGSNIPKNMLYCFDVPSVERKQNDKWHSIPMAASWVTFVEGDPGYFWNIFEGADPDAELKTDFTIDVNELTEKLEIGEYRVVIFCGDLNLYCNFTIEK